MQHSYPVKVSDIRRETPECVSVAFDIPEPYKNLFKFEAGQYINIIKNVDGEELHRSYSLCVSPSEGEYRVAIKKMDNGKFSTYANELLKVGELVELMPPNGKFIVHCHPEHQKKYLFIATGSGITPVISLIKTILEQEPQSSVSLLYGNSSIENIIFKDQLLDLKNLHISRLQIHFILSQEQVDEEWLNGRINSEKLKYFNARLFDVRDIDEVFICGPETMILDCKETLMNMGIEENQIHIELFGTEIKKDFSQIKKTTFGETAKVRLKTDGRTTEFELEYGTSSILEAALGKKINLPFACKGGVCCTCKAKLIEGEVSMLKNYGLEKEEIAAGYILTCQSYPKSKELVVDFDQK